jgi:hypothetical protein
VLRSGTRAAPLAALAGISPAEYLRRSPADQYVARLEIERELVRRREVLREVVSAPPDARGAGRGHDREQDSGPLARRARQFGSWLR